MDAIEELVNLYHLARVPLSGKSCTRHDRLLWAAGEYHKLHPETSPLAAYKMMDRESVGLFIHPATCHCNWCEIGRKSYEQN